MKKYFHNVQLFLIEIIYFLDIIGQSAILETVSMS
uniref:Uncharacterized protein n=1 Tax=Arundo donax TaxID=35708 RepID=A0A0A9BE21_ARUDO